MPYVKRDQNNHIIEISETAKEFCNEFLVDDAPEVLEYAGSQESDSIKDLKAEFIKEDLDFIRVMEDLIDTLIAKQVICFTDLPEPVQKKIVRRRKIRTNISRDQYTLDDNSPLI